MRRAVVAMAFVAFVAGGAAFAAPSEAARPAVSAAADGVYVSGYGTFDTTPPTGFMHLAEYEFDSASTTSYVAFTASSGPYTVVVTLGSSGGPVLTNGAAQLPVTVNTTSSCEGTAWVAIDDIAFDGSGKPTRLATHFSLRCSGSTRDVAIAAMLYSSVAERATHTSRPWPCVGAPCTPHRPSGFPSRSRTPPLCRCTCRASRRARPRLRWAPITARTSRSRPVVHASSTSSRNRKGSREGTRRCWRLPTACRRCRATACRPCR